MTPDNPFVLFPSIPVMGRSELPLKKISLPTRWGFWNPTSYVGWRCSSRPNGMGGAV